MLQMHKALYTEKYRVQYTESAILEFVSNFILCFLMILNYHSPYSENYIIVGFDSCSPFSDFSGGSCRGRGS